MALLRRLDRTEYSPLKVLSQRGGAGEASVVSAPEISVISGMHAGIALADVRDPIDVCDSIESCAQALERSLCGESRELHRIHCGEYVALARNAVSNLRINCGDCAAIWPAGDWRTWPFDLAALSQALVATNAC